jgi:hypothetical protein
MEFKMDSVEDVWIPSVCSLCYNQCGILAHRVNGVIVKIEGNPESPLGMGRLCPKGLAGIMTLYDPHRVNTPLKRTNPNKGMGVDPKWVEISWEEALNTIEEKLKKIRNEDPRKLVFTGCMPSIAPILFASAIFMPSFGSPNVFWSDGHHCGNAEHLLAAALHGAVTTNPDMDYCHYLILFGCNCGASAYYAFNVMAQRLSDARARGMKVVVVDNGSGDGSAAQVSKEIARRSWGKWATIEAVHENAGFSAGNNGASWSSLPPCRCGRRDDCVVFASRIPFAASSPLFPFVARGGGGGAFGWRGLWAFSATRTVGGSAP